MEFRFVGLGLHLPRLLSAVEHSSQRVRPPEHARRVWAPASSLSFRLRIQTGSGHWSKRPSKGQQTIPASSQSVELIMQSGCNHSYPATASA